MKLSKNMKIVLGIFTFLDAFYPFFPALIMPVFLFSFISSIETNTMKNPEPMIFGLFMAFFFLIMFFSLLNLVLDIVYIVFIIKNKKITDLSQILFVLGTFFLPYITMPLYFILYFWKDKPEGEGSLPSA